MKKRIAVRILSALMALLLLAALCALAGCRGNADGQEKKLSVVAAVFPVYDWVKNILGDRAESVELTLLLDSGVDLHNYQPTVDDIVKLSNCDLFIYVGGESDGWAADALKDPRNPGRKVINLLEVLGDAAKDEETVAGMEHGDDHEDDHEEADGHEDEAEGGEGHGAEKDEHVWLSLRNAGVFCASIAAQLASLDPDNGETYRKNLQSYTERLNALDGEYRTAVEAGARKTVLFGDRFPFRYLADDYGLDYYAAFPGCSAETEASFETVTFLAGRVDALGLPCVLTVDGARHRIAQTVVENTKDKNQPILTMDSMQSATLADAENGKTYLSVMQKNLEVLKTALR